MIKRLLFALFHPSWWFVSGRYSKGWDYWLRSRLEKGIVFDLTELRRYQHKNYTANRGCRIYSIEVDGVEVWCGSGKYAFGNRTKKHSETRASRYTSYLLHKELKKQYRELADKYGLLYNQFPESLWK